MDAEPDWAVRRPHPALRALVSRDIGYRQHAVLLPVHRGLPSQHVTLIIGLAARGLVGGLHTGRR